MISRSVKLYEDTMAEIKQLANYYDATPSEIMRTLLSNSVRLELKEVFPAWALTEEIETKPVVLPDWFKVRERWENNKAGRKHA